MRKIGLIITTLALLLLSFTAIALADGINFYEGDLSITSVDVVVDATDDAQITATYVVKNTGSGTEIVTLSFWPEDAELTVGGLAIGATTGFAAGQQRTVVATYTKSPAGDGNLRVLRIAPELMFDGDMYAGTAGSYDIQVTLPAGIPALAASSRTPDSWSSSGGRAVAEWSASDAYPTSLTVQWNMLGANIAVSAYSDTDTVTVAGQHVTVDVLVENMGATTLQNIELECSFTPADFEGIEPVDAFDITEPENSDPRLVWIESIASLGAGQSRTVSFTIAVLNAAVNISLEPIRVTIDDELVATSDHVNLETNLTGIIYTPTVETTTTPPITTTPAPGLFAVLASLGLVLLIAARKR